MPLSMDCKMDSHLVQALMDCSGPGREERGAGLETSEHLFAHFVPAAGMVKAIIMAVVMADALAAFVSSLVSTIMDAKVQAEAQAVVILSERLLV